MGEGPVHCHDSSAWIKCGTFIWVKIMESYMSLSMSAFRNEPKWKVTTGRSWGGRQGCWNGNWVTMRPPNGWPAIKQRQNSLSSSIKQLKTPFSHCHFFVFLFTSRSWETPMYKAKTAAEEYPWDFTVAYVYSECLIMEHQNVVWPIFQKLSNVTINHD